MKILLSLTLATAMAGCATRSLPARFSATSPSSPAAVEGKRTPVTAALQGDPPLPDEDEAPRDHEGHGGHHHHEH